MINCLHSDKYLSQWYWSALLHAWCQDTICRLCGKVLRTETREDF